MFFLSSIVQCWQICVASVSCSLLTFFLPSAAEAQLFQGSMCIQ